METWLHRVSGTVDNGQWSFFSLQPSLSFRFPSSNFFFLLLWTHAVRSPSCRAKMERTIRGHPAADRSLSFTEKVLQTAKSLQESKQRLELHIAKRQRKHEDFEKGAERYLRGEATTPEMMSTPSNSESEEGRPPPSPPLARTKPFLGVVANVGIGCRCGAGKRLPRSGRQWGTRRGSRSQRYEHREWVPTPPLGVADPANRCRQAAIARPYGPSRIINPKSASQVISIAAPSC